MKPLSFCLTICFVVLSSQTQAKIWRVNNMPGVTADATTAQAAHDMASDGDTIHLEPSVNNYGGVSCTKRLTWLSIGGFLAQNPGKQASTILARVSTMYLYDGSGGSVVSVNNVSSINIYAANVTINKSYIESTVSVNSTANNCVINQSYTPLYFSLSGTNTIVSNNLSGYGLTMSGTNSSAIITNNVFNFIGRNEQYFGTANFYNCVYQNNISVKGGNNVFNNSQVSYNMAPDASFAAGNFNQQNVDMSTVFVNSTGSIDKDFILKAGSPAIGVGAAGADLGAFGGTTPFVLALQPSIPAITALSSPAINNASTITVTFSAKSNQ